MSSYVTRRSQLETYFDRTAVEAWSRLTSDAPVSKIRATVRAGRDAMRTTLLDWLPADMTGLRLLDAGCGTGALAVEAARRGATVTAIDMLDPWLGRFDHVVAMDSLIHYQAPDIVRALAELSLRTDGSVVFTVAPSTALLTLMHAAGKLFPKADRAPAIVPITEGGLRRRIAREPALERFAVGRTRRINSGFYLSNAIELTNGRTAPPGERR